MSVAANSIHKKLHRAIALNRRLNILTNELSAILPDQGTVLDVGCGSGEIDQLILERKPGLKIRGIDILVRPDCVIEAESYNGENFPAADKSYDYVMFVDVLHHTPDPFRLLQEAFRVAKVAVIIKDHNCDTFFARKVMTCTDWLGNWQYGVQLLFNFWKNSDWQNAWKRLGVTPASYNADFGLYPLWTRIIFAKDMDFIAKIPVPTNKA